MQSPSGTFYRDQLCVHLHVRVLHLTGYRRVFGRERVLPTVSFGACKSAVRLAELAESQRGGTTVRSVLKEFKAVCEFRFGTVGTHPCVCFVQDCAKNQEQKTW